MIGPCGKYPLEKAFDKLMFVSYAIVVAMLVVKSSFASYRRNSASYDAFY